MDVVHEEATRIQRAGTRWLVKVGGDTSETHHLVLACPAHVCGRLLDTADPVLASQLAQIPYSSAILVTLAYERSKLPHTLDGFGFLVPRLERRTVAAATWVSTKFPSRVPATVALLRAFIVGQQAEELLDVNGQSLVELARSDLGGLMSIDKPPLFTSISVWPRSMPQYAVGHADRLFQIAKRLDHCSGLFLVGNAYHGIGVPDCVQMAKETAKRIAASEM
jgi:protoporphyrinogen/coproporphyrinogen III oxidase